MWLAPTLSHWSAGTVGYQPSLSIPSERNLCLCIFPRLHTCTILSETFTHQSSQPLHMKTQMFFKSRTNPNKAITPDCPLLNCHWLARTWVIWRIKNLWHYHATLSWNNKEEKLHSWDGWSRWTCWLRDVSQAVCQEARKAVRTLLEHWIWNAALGAWKCRELRNRRG